MGSSTRRHSGIGWALIFVLLGGVFAGCDSGEGVASSTTTTTVETTTSTVAAPVLSTSTSTTTTLLATTSTTLPLLEPADVSDYLLIVLRAARDSGVNERTAELMAQPSPEANEALLEALRTNLDQLERVVPPAEAREYHSRIVEQAAATVALYEALIEAVGSGDTAAIEELAGEALLGVGDFTDVGQLQLELLGIAFEGRTDPLAGYVLEVTELGIILSADIEGFIARLDEVLAGEQNLELLAAVVDEEAALLLALAEDFRELHPPQVAASYHASQMQAAGGVGGALARMATAVRDDDVQSFQRASQAMFGFMTAASEALVAQQDMLIAAIEGPGPDPQTITWASVPLGSEPFGFASDVVAFEGRLLSFGSESFESEDGLAWFGLGRDFSSFESIDDAVVVGNQIVGVGARRGSSSLDAGVWTSSDGSEWTPLSADTLDVEGTQAMSAVAAADDGYVAIGSRFEGDEIPSAAIWHARRLDDWTLLDFPDAADPVVVAGVASDGDGYVVVGSGLWTSDDGRTWEVVDVGDAGLSVVRHTTFGYLAVGQDTTRTGIVLRSTGVEEWSRSELPGSDGATQVGELVEVGGRLLAFGWVELADERFELAAWESGDGVSWERVNVGSPLTSRFPSRLAGAVGGPGVVVVGSSADGPFAWLGFIP